MVSPLEMVLPSAERDFRVLFPPTSIVGNTGGTQWLPTGIKTVHVALGVRV